MTREAAQSVIVVGAGISGLSAAARLAQSGLSVTLLEASKPGIGASTRNQGWLYSGGWFAPERRELARQCYQSMQTTLRFCSDGIEPDHEGMFYVLDDSAADAENWTQAWSNAGIPFTEASVTQVQSCLPGIELTSDARVWQLPDRAFRPDVVLQHLADAADAAGAHIRPRTPVRELTIAGDAVIGVVTSSGEQLHADLTILAAGADSARLLETAAPSQSDLGAAEGSQPLYALVTLKGHLVSVSNVGTAPLCVMDRFGFNHVPHGETSVFGSNCWQVVSNPQNYRVDRAEADRLWKHIHHYFPQLRGDAASVREMAGTTVQAMHVDQVEPGRVTLPTVIDYAEEPPALQNLLGIFPGRASLWAQLAEDTLRTVGKKLQAPLPTAPAPWDR